MRAATRLRQGLLVRALAASAGVHAIAAEAWLLRERFWPAAATGAAVDVTVATVPAEPEEEPAPVEIAMVEPAAPTLVAPPIAQPEEPPRDVPEPALARLCADETRTPLTASAPTRAQNPDLRARLAAASSGQGAGVAELLVTGRRDEETLRALAFDADRGYQQERIRTAAERTSREQVRATPHPEYAAELASREGAGRARALRASPVEGREARRAAGQPRAKTPAGIDEAEEGPDSLRASPPVAAVPRIGGATRRSLDGSDEAPGQRRPAVQRNPAATDAARAADDVADDRTASLVSNERRPSILELSRPGPVVDHPDGSSRGDGDAPAFSRHGQGAEPIPAGAPDAPTAAELAVATYRRRYNQYIADVRRRIDPLWEFPHELAIQLYQGEVIVAFTIRSDGRLKDLKVVKSSGFPRFDANVTQAIRAAAPFPPLPATLAPELRVTAPFEGTNPVVR